MTAHPRRHWRIVRTAIGIDWAIARYVAPVRAAVACMLVISGGIVFGDPRDAVPLALGALFTAVCDPRGVFRLRLRGLGLAMFAMAATSWIALLVSSNMALHLVGAVVVAFACGYAGLAGPRAALAGMVALVIFAIYSGMPEPLGTGLRTALLVLIGGAVAAAAILLPLLLRRMGGVRADVAIAYRALALPVRDDPDWRRSAAPAARRRAAATSVEQAGPRGATGAWYAELLEALEEVDLGLTALGAVNGHGAERARRAVARCLLAVAAAVEIEWRRRGVPAALAEAESALEGIDGPACDRAVALVRTGLRRGASAVMVPFPLGRRAEFDLVARVPRDPLAVLWRRADADAVFRRHGLRLAACIGVATVITDISGVPHDYWLPMTIAWVLKPDYATTVPRLVARVLGVIAGGLVAGAALWFLTMADVGIVAISGIGALLFIAFVQAGYAVATAGVTGYVLAVLLANGDPLSDTLGPQFICAIGAGLIAWAAMRVWPTRSTARMCGDLAAAARAIAVYAAADATARPTARRSAEAAAVGVDAVVYAALHEPDPHRLERHAASDVALALADARAIAAALEVDDAQADDRSVEALAALGDRLDAFPVPVAGAPDVPADPLGLCVRRALSDLEAAPSQWVAAGTGTA